MNSLTFTFAREHQRQPMERAQLESRIEWRRTQIKALDVLRNHLNDLKGDKQGDELCDATALSRRFAGISLHPQNIDEKNVRQLSWSIGLSDGSQYVVDVSFFSGDEQSLLAQVLHAAKVHIEKGAAANVAHPSIGLHAKEIDAMKIKIRDRIDEFNQLNRDDFESLRVLF